MSTGHVRRRIHARHGRRSTAAWSTAVFPSRSVSADRWSRLAGGRPGWFPPEFGWVVGCSYRGTPAERTMVRHFIGGNMSLRRRLVVECGGFDWHDRRGPALDAVGARRRRRRDVCRHRMLARRSRCPIRQLERECQEYGGRVTDLPPCSLVGSINAEARAHRFGREKHRVRWVLTQPPHISESKFALWFATSLIISSFGLGLGNCGAPGGFSNGDTPSGGWVVAYFR
jgi:hypothetical protein